MVLKHGHIMHKITKQTVKHKGLKVVLIWLVINTLIGLIIAYFLSLSLDSDFFMILLGAGISTHTISGLPAATCYFLSRYTRNMPLWKNLALMYAAAVTAALLGREISLIIVHIITHYAGMPDYYTTMQSITGRLTVPVIILTVLISTIVLYFERQRKARNAMEQELALIKSKSTVADSGTGQEIFSFRESGSQIRIKYRDIIYLSSQGKKTLLHTTNGDFEISSLLKDVEKQLAVHQFLRIHKRYIVNQAYFSRLRYYEGGRYNLYLSDEDESILPVGKKYTSLIKERFTPIVQ